jgi:nucleotide-binding universal stress UspA family protein
MYKKILVPLDGSKRAEAILPHVEELAHRFDAEIYFLMIVEPIKVFAPIDGYIPSSESLQGSHDIAVKGANTYLQSLRGKFREKRILARAIVEEGSIVSKIIEISNRENIDLIAMASHGRTGLSHVFYGSVAAGVLHRIDRPLLLIRAGDN